MKRALRVTVSAVGVLVAGLAMLVVGTVLFLRSPRGSQFILSRVQAAMTKSGYALSYRAARVDPFSTISFEDLNLIKHADHEQTEVRAKAIDIRYKIFLLSRTVVIDKAAIEGVSVLVHHVSGTQESAESSRASGSSGSPVSTASLKNLVNSPPVRVVLRELSVIGLNLDVDYRTPTASLSGKTEGLAFATTLEMLRGKLESSGKFTFGKSGRWALSLQNDDKQTEMAFLPEGSANWAGIVRREGSKWIYDMQSTHLSLALKHILTDQHFGASQSRAEITSLTLKSEAGISASTSEFLTWEASPFSSLTIKGLIQAGPALLVQKAGRKTTKTLFEVANGEISLTKEGGLASEIALKNLRSDGYMLRPASFNSATTIRFSPDMKTFDGSGKAELNAIRLVEHSLSGSFSPNLGARVVATINVDRRLADIVKPLKTLRTARLLPGRLEASLSREATGRATIAADLKLPEISAPVLRKPWKVDLSSRVSWEEAIGRAAGQAILTIQGADALRFKASSTLGEDAIQAEGVIETYFGDYLEGLVARDKLARYGSWRSRTEIKLRLDSSHAGQLARTGRLTAEAATTATQQRPQKTGQFADGGITVSEPISLKQQFDLNRGKLEAQWDTTVPVFEVAGVGKIKDTRLHATVTSPDIASGNDIDFVTDLSQGDIGLAGETAKNVRLSGLNMHAKATVRNRDRLALEECRAELNHAMVSFVAEASGRLKQSDFQARGKVEGVIPVGFPSIANQKLSGRIEFPWTLAVMRGSEINFDGILGLTNINWSKQGRWIRGITGRVPVSERIRREGAQFRFAYLITQNPFERVDYERLRPLIRGAEQLRVEQLGFEDKIYGPFIGFFSMRQNMVFAHQFEMDVGKSGLAYGEMYIDVYPSNLQMGFLSRLTNLNLVEILPRRLLASVPEGDKNLSGRSGIVINLNRGSVDGRIDITEIGASQLITLINVLDPKYEDEKMNRTRSALGVGYPSFVEMSFQKGYMDLGIDLVLLGISQRVDVRGIPISTLVSSATSDLVRKSEEGP